MMFVSCGPTLYQTHARLAAAPVAPGNHAASSTRVDVDGAAANMARTVTALGHEATFITMIGDGPIANLCRSILLEDDVDVHDVAGVGEPPLSAVITGPGGEAIHASGLEDGRESDYPAPSVLDGASALLIDGALPHLQLPLARQAKQNGLPIITHLERHTPDTEAMIALSTHVIVSPRFSFPDLAGADPATLVSAIYHRGPAFVARSSGADPIVVAFEDKAYSIDIPDLPPGDIADTIGAGHVLTAGFAVSMADGTHPLEAVGAGAQVATVSLKYEGANGWARSFQER